MSPLPADLTALMLDQVTIEPVIGKDKFNNFQFGPATTVKCQIVRANKEARDRGGRELTSTVQVILADPTLNISTDSRLTLPDGSHPAIIEIMGAKDDVSDYWLEIRA